MDRNEMNARYLADMEEFAKRYRDNPAPLDHLDERRLFGEYIIKTRRLGGYPVHEEAHRLAALHMSSDQLQLAMLSVDQ